MPRAPKRCPHCRNFQPCKFHPRGWVTNNSPKLPRNWKSLCRATRARVKGQYGVELCEHCKRSDLKTEVDHIVNRARGGTDDLSNLQLLCVPCHRLKTVAEAHGYL